MFWMIFEVKNPTTTNLLQIFLEFMTCDFRDFFYHVAFVTRHAVISGGGGNRSTR